MRSAVARGESRRSLRPGLHRRNTPGHTACRGARCGAVLRAGNATGHLLAPDAQSARLAIGRLRSEGIHATLEAASDAARAGVVAWDASGNELAVMQRVKADFDPLQLLNRGRLYGVI